jgi:hypothetical protein
MMMHQKLTKENRSEKRRKALMKVLARIQRIKVIQVKLVLLITKRLRRRLI